MRAFSLRCQALRVASIASFVGSCGDLAWADDVQLLYPDNNVSSKPILEFRARPPTAKPPSAGHTFVFLGRELDNGTTVFYGAGGFYPENNTVKNLLSGPGSVKYTIDDMKTDQVFRVRITPDQEELVKYILTNWETKTYAVAWQNCVSLERDVARAIGLATPEFDPKNLGGEIPSSFVETLRKANSADEPLKHDALETKRLDAVRQQRQEELRNVEALLRGRQEESQKRLERAQQSSPGSNGGTVQFNLGPGGSTPQGGQGSGSTSGGGAGNNATMQLDTTVRTGK